MPEVKIYGKVGWPYTDRARAAYRSAIFIDVKKDAEKLSEMLKLTGGQRRVPVIVDGTQVTIGYNRGSWNV